MNTQPETWRWCRDCAELTSGHCWRHSSWTFVVSTTYVIPDSRITITPAIVVPQSSGDPYAGR